MKSDGIEILSMVPGAEVSWVPATIQETCNPRNFSGVEFSRI